VTSLERSPRGIRLHTQAGTTLDCSGVILAVPAYAAATLVASLSSAAAPVLAAIPYHPSTNVSIAFRREQITHALDASGFATAPAVTGPVRACTFASSKFPGRAPDGYALLRAFVTTSSRDAATVALATLAPILGIRGAPLWSRTFSWSQGIPRYGVAHRDDVAAVRQALARSAPLALAGAGYDGAGVSACVRSGRNAARELLARV
jgi:oxygen-dependent protoporphyrinogen oxidase